MMFREQGQRLLIESSDDLLGVVVYSIALAIFCAVLYVLAGL